MIDYALIKRIDDLSCQVDSWEFEDSVFTLVKAAQAITDYAELPFEPRLAGLIDKLTLALTPFFK